MKFEITGYNLDSLIKTLNQKKVTLYNIVRPEHNRIIFSCNDADHKKVERYIKNYKVHEGLTRAKQIPKFILSNVGLLLGVFFGIIFACFVTNFTWQIKIYGTKDLTENEIIEVLSNNGVSTKKINLASSEEIESILLNNYDRIAQVSVIKKGTAIIINLSEKLVYSEEVFAPITAKYSGIITNINVVTGTCNVKVGDYVNVGDELVLPFNLNSMGEKVSVRPLAEIKAQIFITAKTELKKEEICLVRTGKTAKVYNYKFGKFKFFSGKNKNSFALFDCVSYNENVTDLLPLNRDVLIYYELTTAIKQHDFSLERDALIEKSKQEAESMLPPHESRLSTSTKVVELADSMFALTTVCLIGYINA